MGDLRDDQPRASAGNLPTEVQVARIRSEDPTAFAELFDRLAPSVEAWAQVRVTGSLRDYVEPCDVVQEVWWRAMDGIHSYQPERSSFRAWIFTIATNVLLEWNRKRRRKLRLEPRALAERVASLPPAVARQATSVGRNLRVSESANKLAALVATLDEEDRAVFIHCGLEGLTAAETAALAGSTPEAIKKRWQRLRQRLEPNPIWSEFSPDP